jgi:Tfp pilus assembly protein PilN
MAGDDIETLMTAREALTKQRLSWAQTIASQSETPEIAIKAIIDVQQAIEVIDIAIEELEAKLEDEMEETEEDADS